MENKTKDQKELFLTNARTIWLQEIHYLCVKVPMGVIGAINLIIFLKIIIFIIFLRSNIC